MNLVLYSGGHNHLNHKLDDDVFKGIQNPDPVFTYIPSKSEEAGPYFERIKSHYKKFNVKEFIFLPLDQDPDETTLQKALQSDLIYLSGGNAFYFLRYLKLSGFNQHLKKYYEGGGTILGVNAGANLLTPTIITATIPSDKLDHNEIKQTDLKGLGLVDFEFTPHYDGTSSFTSELINYSKQTPRTIYAVPDGSAIMVKNGQKKFLGAVYKFQNGKMEEIIRTNL